LGIFGEEGVVGREDGWGLRSRGRLEDDDVGVVFVGDDACKCWDVMRCLIAFHRLE
jgi:hypothetical protein